MRRKQFSPSWWDRRVASVAPVYGMRRIQTKLALHGMGKRHYKAASSGRRTEGWYRSGADANASIERALPALRELSRDLRRNNSWAKRAISAISNSTIGWGIRPKAVLSKENPELMAEAMGVWRDWADSVESDYDGRLTFAGLQRLVMDTVVESGEALVVRVAATTQEDLPIPLRIRVLEPDYLDSSKDQEKAENKNRICQGVEFDSAGRRTAYHLYDEHPGNNRAHSIDSTRYPAKSIIHVYYIERPGQIRGAPWLTSAIDKLHDLDDFEDAALVQQRIAACFGAFVSDMESNAPPLGTKEKKTERVEQLEPGMIEYLPQGRTVTFATPPQPTNVSFTAGVLRRIAAGVGITYEQISGDYSKSNFSAARMARTEHFASVNDWRSTMVAPQLLNGVWKWVMDLAAGMRGWAEVPRARWSAPPVPMLEPGKEGLAYTRLLRSGIKTLPEVLIERGRDPDEHLAELAESNTTLDKLGIVVDSDPRKVTMSGQMQPDVNDDDEGDKSDDDEDDE